MTEFRKLAKEIEEDIDGIWLCCIDLPKEKVEFFVKYFRPTDKEQKEYNQHYHIWMGEIGQSRVSDNNLRILALLFAEQLWNDFQEGER